MVTNILKIMHYNMPNFSTLKLTEFQSMITSLEMTTSQIWNIYEQQKINKYIIYRRLILFNFTQAYNHDDFSSSSMTFNRIASFFLQA